MSDALFRLVGDGDRQTGGAIPLPDAFSAVVNYLIDNDSGEFRTLNRIVSTALQWKEDRIMAAAWRSWEGFTRDILTCLSEMGLAQENQSRWELTVEFVPGHRFYLPGTNIWFIGRGKEDRDQWEGNESLYLALNSVVEAIKGKASKADPLAVTLVQEAVKVLAEKLNLNEKPLTPQQKYYRKTSARKPHEQGKRLRHGMSDFFREFWDKHAVDGEWYTIEDVSVKFDELHPDQPSTKNGHLQGSMRRVARDMVEAGQLDQSRVMGNGAWKKTFRKKQTQAGTRIGPYVTYDELRKGWGGDPKV